METKKKLSFGRLHDFTKRVFDIVFSIVAILLFSPIMLIIFIILKLKCPKNSVIFTQKRLGEYEKEIKVYKFTTMVPHAEEILNELLEKDEVRREEYLTHRKLKDDPRIIPGIGNFLRSTSLDELPQFYNVLRGEMTVVGPRPYIKDEFNGQLNIIRKKITSLKPGLTGYWQILPSRNSSTFEDRIANDLKYIENQTIFLDMEIIFKTIIVMVLRKGT